MEYETVTMDMSLNEGSTFTMDIEFWQTAYMTGKEDLTGSTFEGEFKFGVRIIPMTVAVYENVVNFSVAFEDMERLPNKGSYNIHQLVNADSEKFRLMEGTVRIDQQVTI